MIDEVELYWRYISAAAEALLACTVGLTPDELDWRPSTPKTNSLRVLVTHTFGNLREYILEILCGGSVGRDRSAEFATEGGPADDFGWPNLRAELQAALEKVDDAELGRLRAHPRSGPMRGREVLLFACLHAQEHRGQAELTLQLLRSPDS